MKLKKKLAYYLIILTLVCSVGITLVTAYVVSNDFREVEENNVLDNVHRAVSAIENDVDFIDSMLVDWAYWDSTYSFLSDKNEKYISENFEEATLSNLDINFIIIFNQSNDIYYSVYLNTINGKFEPMPEEIIRIVKDSLPQNESKGILMSSHGPIIYSKRDILPSMGYGSSLGKMIFARYFDDSKIGKISNITKLKIEMVPLNDSRYSDFLFYKSSSIHKITARSITGNTIYLINHTHSLTSSNVVKVDIVSKDSINGFVEVTDIQKKPAFLLEISLPREIHKQSLKLLLYIILSGCLLAGLLSFGYMIVINKLVLKRVISFENALNSIKSSSDKKIRNTGNDEISSLIDSTNELLSRINELDKAKSEFLNVVSHELKTPLTAIIAHLDVLEELKGNMTHEEIASLEVLKKNSNNLKLLIANILEVSRLEAGTFELSIGNASINEIIRLAKLELDILAKQKGIRISTRLENIGKIECDEQRVHEIITNLISNAIKFTNKGHVKIETKNSGNGISIIVSDTGIGIPKGKMNNLFQKFYQVDASLSRRYGGTGLGLSITKKMVEMHGGNITVKSVEDHGSAFTVWLPKKQPRKKSKKIFSLDSSKNEKGGKNEEKNSVR